MAAGYPDLEIHEIQEIRKFRKPKYEEKYIDLAQSLARKQRTLKPICSLTKQSNWTKINRCRHMTEFPRLYSKQMISWSLCYTWHKYHWWYFRIVPNLTRLTAREIMYNNFELSLVVFLTKYHYKSCSYLY